METRYTRRKAACRIVLSVLVMLVLGWLGTRMPNEAFDTTQDRTWTRDYIEWFVYRFPLVRIWDVYIGCNLGYLFVQNKTDRSVASTPSRRRCTTLEATALLLSAFAIALHAVYYPVTQVDDIKIPAVSGWWLQSLVWLPASMLLVYSFAEGRGAISQALVNPVTMYLARISPYAFLIHRVVFCYLVVIYWHIIKVEDPNAFAQTWGALLNLTVGLALTLLACEIWTRIQRYVRQRMR